MNARGSFGWAVVLLALAVPGLMYYFWWAPMDKASRAQMTQRVRKRLPGGASLFSGSPSQGKLTNPIAAAPGVAAAPLTISTAAPAAAPAKTGEAQAPAKAAETPAPPPALAAATPPSDPHHGEASTPPAKPPPLPITRDPTLSPYDRVRIEQLALEKANARDEVQREVNKRRVPAIESTVEVQGIIFNAAGGAKAIVNGEMVGIGDPVGGGVRVMRITRDGVVFRYRNRTFSKLMSQ